MPGNGDIKDDQVRLGFESNLNGKFPIGNQESIIAIGFQHPAQAFPYLFNIICDDDAILFVSDAHRVLSSASKSSPIPGVQGSHDRPLLTRRLAHWLLVRIYFHLFANTCNQNVAIGRTEGFTWEA